MLNVESLTDIRLIYFRNKSKKTRNKKQEARKGSYYQGHGNLP
jgi:hypothetical protein